MNTLGWALGFPIAVTIGICFICWPIFLILPALYFRGQTLKVDRWVIPSLTIAFMASLLAANIRVFFLLATFGFVFGYLQSIVIRQKFPLASAWVMASAAGWTLGGCVSLLIFKRAFWLDNQAILILLYVCFGGITAGILQWYTIHRELANSIWWLVTSSFAWTLILVWGWSLGNFLKTMYDQVLSLGRLDQTSAVDPAVLNVVYGFYGTAVILYLGIGFIFGAITGIPLVWLLRDRSGGEWFGSTHNIHIAAQTKVIDQDLVGNIQYITLEQRWAKDDIGYSLHVVPASYAKSGIQLTDLLAYLAFTRSKCQFFDENECYAHWVSKDFESKLFARFLEKAYFELVQVEQDLNACGLNLHQTEGWDYFQKGDTLQRDLIKQNVFKGDAHKSKRAELINSSEDDNFKYALSFIESDTDRGWVFHYRPKQLPISIELKKCLDMLGLVKHNECPFFEFESCLWHYVSSDSDLSLIDKKRELVYEWYTKHEIKFSSAVSQLLKIHSQFLPFGFGFYFFSNDLQRSKEKEKLLMHDIPLDFDVAISFASTERDRAESLARLIRDAGFKVFYDNFYEAQLWGKELATLFDEIYRKRSRFCVIFISKEYEQRLWTNVERRSVQARAVQEKGSEYILPIRVDNTDIPGILPTIAYQSLAEKSIEEIAEILIEKLRTK